MTRLEHLEEPLVLGGGGLDIAFQYQAHHALYLPADQVRRHAHDAVATGAHDIERLLGAFPSPRRAWMRWRAPGKVGSRVCEHDSLDSCSHQPSS